MPAARSTAVDYRGAMQFIRPRVEGWKTPVLLTSAHTGKGVDKVWNKILRVSILLLINRGGLGEETTTSIAILDVEAFKEFNYTAD